METLGKNYSGRNTPESAVGNRKCLQSAIGNDICHAITLCCSVQTVRTATTSQLRIKRPHPIGSSFGSTAVVVASTPIIKRPSEKIADCRLPIADWNGIQRHNSNRQSAIGNRQCPQGNRQCPQGYSVNG